ncbi:MAG: NAD-binding protein [Helicobacteraceae bacterium]|jgi:voltage-gated potassium channel|nr:NAD-binding protein [Helicobacteraceae bacterium]
MLRRIKEFLHWSSTSKPEVDIDGEIYSHLRPFRIPVIMIIVVSMIGTLGYVAIDNMSLIDAFYQTGITFTTVGFGEIAPISYEGRIFTILLIVLGFAIFTFSIGMLNEVLGRGNLISLFKERTMLYKVARLKNHFVIFFHNEYAAELSRQLRAAHVPFVVVDAGANFPKEAEELNYPYYINEAPHLDKAILKSHLSSAKGAFCLSKNISDNIALISTLRLYERELGRKPFRILASCEAQSDAEKLKKLGADNVVSPMTLMAQRLSAIAIRPDMENMLESFLYRRDTPLDMEEIEIPRHSWVIFKRIQETHLKEITHTSIVGIKTKDGKFLPMPANDMQIMLDSRMIVIGTSEGVQTFRKLVRRKDKPEELRYI